jgi:valyl-tRNA synthetase
MNVPPSVKTKLFLETKDTELVEQCHVLIQKMAFCNGISIIQNVIPDDCIVCISESARAFIPSSELIDKEKELKRLNTELGKVQKDIDFLQNKLNNPKFVEKAPSNLVEIEKNKLSNAVEKKENILKSIEGLK